MTSSNGGASLSVPARSSVSNGRAWQGTVKVIGFPFAGGQKRSGVDGGPQALRSSGLVERIKLLGHRVVDLGDVDVPPGTNLESPDPVISVGQNGGQLFNAHGVSKATERLFLACHKAAIPAESGDTNSHISTSSLSSCPGDVVVAIGGDHSMAIGTVAAALARDPNVCIVWVDAHADINTPECSPSGNIHGMPCAFLAGLGETLNVVDGGSPVFEWIRRLPHLLDLGRLAYIGLRDLDDGEREIIRRHKITAFTAQDVERLGIQAVMHMAMQQINPDRNRPIHLSFDIDGVDPLYAPSTGTPVAGGITHREARYICEYLHDSGLLRSMDMAEVNPMIDAVNAPRTCAAAIECILAALGHRLL